MKVLSKFHGNLPFATADHEIFCVQSEHFSQRVAREESIHPQENTTVLIKPHENICIRFLHFLCTRRHFDLMKSGKWTAAILKVLIFLLDR